MFKKLGFKVQSKVLLGEFRKFCGLFVMFLPPIFAAIGLIAGLAWGFHKMGLFDQHKPIILCIFSILSFPLTFFFYIKHKGPGRLGKLDAIIHLPPKPTYFEKDPFEEIIEAATKDYQERYIEKQFWEFINANISGYWKLEAGPGLGKTAILAHMSRNTPDEISSFAYFFKFDSIANRYKDFSHYIFRRLVWHYGIYRVLPSDSKDELDEKRKTAEAIEELLHTISKNRLEGTKKRLLIIIDGIDEMENLEANANKGNPLYLPQRLPNNVFVAYSSRPAPDKKENFYSFFCNKFDENNPAHQIDVKTYVSDKVRFLPFVSPYHDADSDGKLIFVEDLCKEAKYNFMFLRCILNDSRYWTQGGKAKDLPKSLEGYYEQHYSRATQGQDKELRQNAIVALCLREGKRISKVNLKKILSEDYSKIKSDISEWIAQGLFHELHEDHAEWMVPYHKSYGEFLKKRSENLADTVTFKTFSQNICKDIDLGGDLETPCNNLPALASEWVILTLKILRLAGEFNSLQTAYSNPKTWQLMQTSREGFAYIIRDIGTTEDLLANTGSQESFIHNLSENVAKLLQEKQICLDDGTPFSYKAFYENVHLLNTAYPHRKFPEALEASIINLKRSKKESK